MASLFVLGQRSILKIGFSLASSCLLSHSSSLRAEVSSSRQRCLDSSLCSSP